MTSIFISKDFNGHTRQFNPAGYQRNQGFFKQKKVDVQDAPLDNEFGNEGDRYKLAPLQTPAPDKRWIIEHSNLGLGKPTISNDRFEKCDEPNRLDHTDIGKQNVICHQKGWRSVGGDGKDNDSNIHGFQWYDPSPKAFEQGLVDPSEKDINWEASRYRYGRYEVPSRLGRDLQGSQSTLQRDNANYLLTDYFQPSGFRRGGYLAGHNGIFNDQGTLPSNQKDTVVPI